MKRAVVISAAVTLLVLVLAVAAFVVVTNTPSPLKENQNQKPFYVGVTFCGNTTTDAKALIEKVKNYTNIFILQSGPLQRDLNAMNEIGDYAVASGLHYSVYWGVDEAFQSDTWIYQAKQRWGDKFLGIYYNDEPGGKMLDSYIDLSSESSVSSVVGNIAFNNGTSSEYSSPQQNASVTVPQLTKLGRGGGLSEYVNGTHLTFQLDGTIISSSPYTDSEVDFRNGTIHIMDSNGTVVAVIPNVPRPEEIITHYPNGTITTWEPPEPRSAIVTYYPNGTITLREGPENNFYTSENGSSRIAQLEPYSVVLAKNPIKNCDDAAQAFVNHNQATLQWLSNQSVTVFTSDYALYWWDYQSGYDVILAEFGWNNTIAQEIALARGAATLQNKTWGAIITWKYTKEPYLTTGDEMFSQMKAAYEAGAEYIVIFNYPKIEDTPYGTLQEDHFQALQRFWNEVVENPQATNGRTTAEAALVLPKNYGWGMRTPNDTIWGFWQPDDKAPVVWSSLQNALAVHGSRLDIVYDDPAYPLAGKYPQIIYWNQTEPATFNSQAPE
jgi:hypothetical protein